MSGTKTPAHLWCHTQSKYYRQLPTIIERSASTAMIAASSSWQARGCPLVGLTATPDLEAHRRRFLDNGWTRADARDMLTVYRHHIDPADRRRRGPRPTASVLPKFRPPWCLFRPSFVILTRTWNTFWT